MYDTADVWAYGVDGSVGAEARGIHLQVGGSLLDQLPDDVDLDLQMASEQSGTYRCPGNNHGRTIGL